MKNYFLSILTLFILSSCAIYTSQNTIPVLIEEKGECQLDGGFSTGGLLASPGLGFNVSYALTDRFQTRLSSSLTLPLTNNGSSYTLQGDGMIGYRFPFNENHQLRVYGGYLYGYSNIVGAEAPVFEDLSFKGDYQSIFGLAQFTKKKKNNFFGASLKTGSFFWRDSNQQTVIKRDIIIEPSLFYNISIQDRWRFNISYSYPLFTSFEYSDDNYFYANPTGNLGFGLSLLLGKK